MTKCPRCDRSVAPEAVQCPHCKNQLKAFGHQGIPLYQTNDNTYLCDRCIYDEDDSCNYPQRPLAKSCTMFHDQTKPLVEETIISSPRGGIAPIGLWCRNNQGLLIIFTLIVISLLLAIV